MLVFHQKARNWRSVETILFLHGKLMHHSFKCIWNCDSCSFFCTCANTQLKMQKIKKCIFMLIVIPTFYCYSAVAQFIHRGCNQRERKRRETVRERRREREGLCYFCGQQNGNEICKVLLSSSLRKHFERKHDLLGADGCRCCCCSCFWVDKNIGRKMGENMKGDKMRRKKEKGRIRKLRLRNFGLKIKLLTLFVWELF